MIAYTEQDLCKDIEGLLHVKVLTVWKGPDAYWFKCADGEEMIIPFDVIPFE